LTIKSELLMQLLLANFEIIIAPSKEHSAATR
jgi:hypothetical protein